MKFNIAVLAVAAAVSTGAVAQTRLSKFLTFDGGSGITAGSPIQAGGEDKLQDDSLSRLIDIGAPGISAGDSVYGVLTLSDIRASGRQSRAVGIDGQIAVVYAGSFLAGTGGALKIVADQALLATVCGAVCDDAGITANSIAVILSTTTPDVNPNRDPLNWDALGANGITANFNGANGNPSWVWELTAGLDKAGTFAEFLGTEIGGTIRAGFTITSNSFGGKWRSVDVNDSSGVRRLADLTIDVGTNERASAFEQSRGWTLRDQSSLFANPIPEPEMWALFAMGLGAVAWRAKQIKKTQKLR